MDEAFLKPFADLSKRPMGDFLSGSFNLQWVEDQLSEIGKLIQKMEGAAMLRESAV